VGWNSLRDVKNKVEDIVNTRVSVITDEYEDRLKILEKLIARYGIMFKKLKCLHSSPIKRIVHGDIVIDHELSETCSNDPNVIDKRSELISSYQIKDGKVVRVLFFR